MTDTFPYNDGLSPKKPTFKISGGTQAMVHFHLAQGVNEITDFLLNPSLSYRITTFLNGLPQLPIIHKSFSTHININQVQTKVVNLNFDVPVGDELLFEVIDNNQINPTDYLIMLDFTITSRT